MHKYLDLIEDGYGFGAGNGHGYGVINLFCGYGEGAYSAAGWDNARGYGCGQGQQEGDKFFKGLFDNRVKGKR